MRRRWRRRGRADAPRADGEVPRAGTIVELDAEGERSASVVVRASPRRIVLQPLPGEGGTRGARVTLQWPAGEGFLRLTCAVAADGTLVPLSPATRLQRRSFVRVRGEIRVRLLTGEASYQARAADISEGGMRCSLAHAVDLVVGQELHVAVLVGNAHLEIPAQVRRRQLLADGRQEVAIAFLALPGEELRRWILQQQLRNRAGRQRP